MFPADHADSADSRDAINRVSTQPTPLNTIPEKSAQSAKSAGEIISQTAQAILDARVRYPDCSFADLYDDDAMPLDLRAAHLANDRAVLAAYGFAPNATESEIVAELMRRYQSLSAH